MERIDIPSDETGNTPAKAGLNSRVDHGAIYRELMPQLISLVAGEKDFIANLANLSAALKQALPYASWVGFYLLKDGDLVVGPVPGQNRLHPDKNGKRSLWKRG